MKQKASKMFHSDKPNGFVPFLDLSKITQYYIEKDISRKNALLTQLSTKRKKCILSFLQWCLTLNVFERIDIMHYVPDIPIGFFSIPFIDEEELFAHGDPQLMSKIKKQQKELKQLREVQYDPKIVLDYKSLLNVEYLIEDDDGITTEKTRLLNILTKEKINWNTDEKDYVKKFSSLLYLISPKAAEFVGDHIGIYKKQQSTIA